MTETNRWYQASDGNWYYGQNPQAFSVPPRPDGQGGWTAPVPVASALAGAPAPVVAKRRGRTLPVVLAALGGLVLGVLVGSVADDPQNADLRARNERLTRELAAARRATTAPAAPAAPGGSLTPSPTVSPTESATPTPAATAPPEFARFTGTTSQRTRAFAVPPGTEWEICYTMRGAGNNAVFLEEPPGEPAELLVNEIGPIRGCTQQFEGGRFSLDVTADGNWSIVVRPAAVA